MKAPVPRSSVRAAALALAVMGVASVAVGFGGALVGLPAGAMPGAPYSSLTGLAVDVDTRWFDDSGYRPVRVRVSAAGPVTSDRTIVFTLMATEFRGGGVNAPPAMTVRRTLTLKTGEQSIEAIVPLPAMRAWRFGWWDVEVDGRRDAQLSLERGKAASLAGNGPDTDIRLLSPTIAGRGAEASSRAGVAKRYLPLASLTADEMRSEPLDDWLAYSGADVVVLDLEELRTLVRIRERAADALRRWVTAGGTLWVEQAGASAKRLREIEGLLKADGWRVRATESERPEEEAPPAVELPEAAETADPDGEESEDAEEAKETTRREPTPIDGAPGWGYANLSATGDLKKEAERLAQRLMDSPRASIARLFSQGGDTKGWYAARDLGFGRVLAFRRKAFDVPLSLTAGGSLIAVRGWQDDYWNARHGVEPDRASEEFGNLLVPGVGVAPVLEFQLLITLFVLVIGPLNYWLLWRREQLQLLVVTTPLCAALFTLGLFGYAAVGDGFGVKARVRSVTLLNQSAGEAVSWSRVSQYAATAPDGPPRLPDDAAVYAIHPAWESAMAGGAAAKRVEWTDGEQRLEAGWLPLRTAVQHLVVRPHDTQARLVFAESPGEGEQPPRSTEVSNQLGVPFDLVLVRDATGEWRRAAETPANAVRPLETVTELEALRDLRARVLESLPEFPVGAGKAIEQTLERFDQSGEVRRLQGNMTAARLDANLGNRMIDALTGLDGGRGLDVPPRTYVAVTSEAIDKSIIASADVEVGSFHVVVGRW